MSCYLPSTIAWVGKGRCGWGIRRRRDVRSGLGGGGPGFLCEGLLVGRREWRGGPVGGRRATVRESGLRAAKGRWLLSLRLLTSLRGVVIASVVVDQWSIRWRSVTRDVLLGKFWGVFLGGDRSATKSHHYHGRISDQAVVCLWVPAWIHSIMVITQISSNGIKLDDKMARKQIPGTGDLSCSMRKIKTLDENSLHYLSGDNCI